MKKHRIIGILLVPVVLIVGILVYPFNIGNMTFKDIFVYW